MFIRVLNMWKTWGGEKVISSSPRQRTCRQVFWQLWWNLTRSCLHDLTYILTICLKMTSSDIDLLGENEDCSRKISSTTIRVDQDIFRTDFVTFCPGNSATLPSSCLRDKTERGGQETRSSKLLNFTTMQTLGSRNLSFRSSLQLDIAEYQVQVKVQLESSATDLEDELRVSTLPLPKQKKLQCNMKNCPPNRRNPARKFSESGVPLLRAERGRHVKSPVDTRVEKVI